MENDKTSLISLLQQLDFNANEARTYAALLELESVSIRKVAEQSGINRGTTYEAIKKLLAHGLVSVRHNRQREYYSAESPEKIYELIRDKRKDLVQTAHTAQEIVPSLLAKAVRPQGRPLVRYYEDDDGIVTILKDVLSTCAQLDEPTYYAYSSRPLRQYIYRKFPQFTKRRIDEGVSVKVIAIGEGGEVAAVSERKWLPEPAGGSISSYVIVYGNKVASLSISSDFTPYGVVIEDAGTAAMQRLLFDQLWSAL